MKHEQRLAKLSEHELLDRFGDLVRRDCHNTAHLLATIAEIDERKLWAKHACPSMFAFCVERFHMSESVTAKRIWAARTARRFPVVLKMVARGELTLSAIQRLSKHLTRDNQRAVLARAKHLSVRGIERLVAELAPKPDVPSRIRALPRASTTEHVFAAEAAGASSVPGSDGRTIEGGLVADSTSRAATRQAQSKNSRDPGGCPARGVAPGRRTMRVRRLERATLHGDARDRVPPQNALRAGWEA